MSTADTYVRARIDTNTKERATEALAAMGLSISDAIRLASGELTQREANRLDAREEHIDNVEDRAKADGVVTHNERVKLEVKQDRSSRAIAKQKHDRQDRG